MIFEVETVYHVYNQGNNREAVFLSESDYRLFEDKMRVHLHPFAHVVAYCLMPRSHLKSIFDGEKARFWR
jgi:putative transposase